MSHAIQVRQTGGPRVLNWTEADVGEPGSGQVRLRHVADVFSINHSCVPAIDCMTRKFGELTV